MESRVLPPSLTGYRNASNPCNSADSSPVYILRLGASGRVPAWAVGPHPCPAREPGRRGEKEASKRLTTGLQLACNFFATAGALRRYPSGAPPRPRPMQTNNNLLPGGWFDAANAVVISNTVFQMTLGLHYILSADTVAAAKVRFRPWPALLWDCRARSRPLPCGHERVSRRSRQRGPTQPTHGGAGCARSRHRGNLCSFRRARRPERTKVSSM